jgi:adenylate cyclase
MNGKDSHKEIEFKFLVTNDEWRNKAKGIKYKQGYLSTDPERVVRIRLDGNAGILTIKGKRKGPEADEFEYEIPKKDAEYMLDNLCLKPLIEKTRYKIEFEGNIWEVDEFHGVNEGLILAEIEVSSKDQKFQKPLWIGKDVTNDPRYRNANLVANPYSKWGK